MAIILTILISTFLFLVKPGDSTQSRQIDVILAEFASEVKEWVGFPDDTSVVTEQCGLREIEDFLLNFHSQLTEIGSSFSKQHLQAIRSALKSEPKLKQFFECLIQKKNTENQFFKEKRKLKYLYEFIKQHPDFAAEAFEKGDKAVDKGYRLGRFFKAFFQYYYFFVLKPSQTVSTTLIRSITVKSDIFDHEDISPCLTLQTSGAISDSLQDLSIQNIYIKIPAAFEALKYMKLKKQCRNQKYLSIVKRMTERLRKVDFFKVMYHEYTPFVEIAAQKYGNKQIQRIGNIFANIINNAHIYQKLSEQEL